jgi:hypothetical protein
MNAPCERKKEMARITSPGKFEGETDLVEYLYSLDATEEIFDDSDTIYSVYELDDEDRQKFPDDHADAFAIILWERSDGFVMSHYCNDEKALDAFKAECEKAIAEREREENEPSDGDITTTDHETFYQYGRIILRLYRGHWEMWDKFNATAPNLGTWRAMLKIDPEDYRNALQTYMKRSRFFPNCWFVSDHGNAHLINLTEKS